MNALERLVSKPRQYFNLSKSYKFYTLQQRQISTTILSGRRPLSSVPSKVYLNSTRSISLSAIPKIILRTGRVPLVVGGGFATVGYVVDQKVQCESTVFPH